jgi:cysteine desulfurase
MMKPIYLDYNATTPVDPRVAEAMQPYLQEHFGNPSSGHVFGQTTRAAIDRARGQVADLLQVTPGEIIFTSGGTEANNHAIIGAALSRAHRGDHIVTSAVEHPAVTEVCRHLENRGFTTTYVGVDASGAVDPQEMIAALTHRTVLVSLMHANNEVGTLQPVVEVAEAARRLGILSHSDCAQSVGKVPVSLPDLGVDMISVAGHKVYGPKGIGVLCLRSGVELPNLMHGAGHEGGRRPGTENVLEIAGLGQACALAARELAEESTRLAALRDSLQERLLAALPGATVNGHPINRLPNTLSIGFPGALAQDLMALMPDVALSAGAACHGHTTVVSHVLRAMGVDEETARGTLRVSLGRLTTEDEVERAATAIIKAVATATGS